MGCLINWPIRHIKLTNKVCVNRIGLPSFSLDQWRSFFSNLKCLFKFKLGHGLSLRIVANRETLVQKDNNRWPYILGRTVRVVKKSHLKGEVRFGSRMVEFEYLAQAFVITLLPVECAKTVFLLSQKPPSWIQTKETVTSLLGTLSRQSVAIQDHTSQDHFCSVINEFPVWNSKSVTPRWWDSTSCPERDTGFGSQVRNHRWSLARVPASAMDVK